MSGSRRKAPEDALGLSPPGFIFTLFDDFLARLEEQIMDPRLDRNDVIRETLAQIYLGRLSQAESLSNYTIPIATRALIASFDPRCSQLEVESFGDLDAAKFTSRKPLIWFWQMYDRSPLGLNAYLGLRVRGLLAPHIFRRVGRNLCCASSVSWSFGYDLSLGDGVIIGRNVVLDDRGGLEIGHHVRIGEGAMIYSHSPEAGEGQSINKAKTVIGDHVRLGFHSVILPGVHVGEGAVIEPMSVVTGNVKPYHVVAGRPAEAVSARLKARGRTASG